MSGNNDLNSDSGIDRSGNPVGSPDRAASPASMIERSKLRKGLLRAHQIVLTALEVANLRLTRVATVAEITECMLPAEVKWIGNNYTKELCSVIPSILELLKKKGLVFSPGRLGKNRYYGSLGVLNPETSPLPDSLSRRRRVLGLVYRAVEHFSRAVRTSDVIDFVSKLQEDVDIDAEFITRDLMNLAENGELNVVGTVRGDGKGVNLYLPSDLSPGSYLPTEPLTWLEEVAQAFGQLWEEEVYQATEEGRRPRPVSTGRVRARLAAFTNPHPNLGTPWYLPNALLQLAETGNALIRKVERQGKRSLMWVPVGLKDGALDLGDAYASDAERVAKAVERACDRLGRPVNVRDVRDEVEMDPTLAPAGRLPLRSILTDISKKTIDAGDGNRRARVTRYCIYVGKFNGDSYYHHHADAADEARSYLRFRQMEQCWSESVTLREPTAYMKCSLPSVAVGRALLVRAEAETLASNIDDLLRETVVDRATRHEAELLREEVSGVMEAASRWLVNNDIVFFDVPRDISRTIPGWTAAELLEVLKPLYPAVKEINSPNRLTTFVKNKISRFLNPEFERRFSKVPHKASEYLYDRTDALLFAATRWGGHECRMQAMIVQGEIGSLRDPRFVYPVLGSPVFEERLRGIAGLAYLWSAEGNERLRQVALNDSEPGLRQSALWAYGFAGGEEAKELLRQRADADQDKRTRDFFREAVACLMANDGLWWKV